MEERFCVGRCPWSGVSGSPYLHPKGSLPGNDKEQGAGKPWEAG